MSFTKEGDRTEETAQAQSSATYHQESRNELRGGGGGRGTQTMKGRE